MAIKNALMTGITDLLILSILSKEDAYAYDISKQIKASSNDALTISLNTIYTAIYKLEREGYVTEYSKLVGRKRTRVYYHLEDKGYAYAKELSDNYLTITAGVDTFLQTMNLPSAKTDTESNNGDAQT